MSRKVISHEIKTSILLILYLVEASHQQEFHIHPADIHTYLTSHLHLHENDIHFMAELTVMEQPSVLTTGFE